MGKDCIDEEKPFVPDSCIKEEKDERRLEVEERVLGFSARCEGLVFKANGAVKNGRKAICTMCTACDSYEEGECKRCKNLGVRTQVDSKSELRLTRNFKDCIDEEKPFVPHSCIKEEKNERRLEVEERVLGDFSARCEGLVFKANGRVKNGRKAICTMCTACDSYEEGECKRCNDLGVRTQVDSKSELKLTRNFKDCIDEE